MFRPENVTARDLELLSSSLDNALSVQEQLEFKKRLTESPHLNTLLEEQKQIKQALAALPARKVPHNFTLTRAEAKKAKRGGFLQPVFAWASAISALLVAVVFGSELIFKTVSLPAPMESASPQIVQFQNENDMTAHAEEEIGYSVMASEPVYLLNWGYGAMGFNAVGGKGGGGGGFATDGGFSINIYVNPNDYYTGESALLGAGSNEFASEAALEDEISIYSESPTSEEAISKDAPLEQELLTEEPLVAATLMMDQEAPRIYGIDPEKLGTVLKTNPDSDDTQLEQPFENQDLAEQEPKNERTFAIPAQVRIGLLAATLIFGLVWLYLKFKR